ncbi:MAG: hypothetical protein M3Q06_08095 [Bacteroidota bacterium]|nr:hypothetical protein [Bacteroidota bacterium]
MLRTPYLYPVRRAIALFFLTTILLAQSPLQQLLKLPVLVAHYSEHRVRNGEMSFFEFIDHHYFTSHPDDGDTDRDQQLPFRTTEVIMMGSTVVVPELFIPFFKPPVFEEKTYPLFNVTGTSSLVTFDIWQPPKSC